MTNDFSDSTFNEEVPFSLLVQNWRSIVVLEFFLHTVDRVLKKRNCVHTVRKPVTAELSGNHIVV